MKGVVYLKTLILFASPRKNGHTMQMVKTLTQNLNGEIELLDCYSEKNILPCIDCRSCRKNFACAINDGMQAIYHKIDTADNIVIASPIYFFTVTAPLKAIIDRCQIYWQAASRKETIARKKGIILLTGGAPSFTNQFLGGTLVLKSFLREINAEFLGEVLLPNTDKTTLSDHPDIAEQIVNQGKMLSGHDISK